MSANVINRAIIKFSMKRFFALIIDREDLLILKKIYFIKLIRISKEEFLLVLCIIMKLKWLIFIYGDYIIM